MVEKTRAVSNPLTIIAIFAGLAEIAGTVSLATVDKHCQHIFIWFVMAFPTLLVAAFFFTLHFRPKVLYAPGDFKDEANFLLLAGNTASTQLQEADTKLDTVASDLITKITNLVNVGDEAKRQEIVAAISRELLPIQAAVASTRSSVDSILNAVAEPQATSTEASAWSVQLISTSVDPTVIARGHALKITYEIESSDNIPGQVWLGASFRDTSNKLFCNTKEDKLVPLSKGRNTRHRNLTIPTDAPLGEFMLGMNLWRGVRGDSRKSTLIASAPPIAIRITE